MLCKFNNWIADWSHDFFYHQRCYWSVKWLQETFLITKRRNGVPIEMRVRNYVLSSMINNNNNNNNNNKRIMGPIAMIEAKSMVAEHVFNLFHLRHSKVNDSICLSPDFSYCLFSKNWTWNSKDHVCIHTFRYDMLLF